MAGRDGPARQQVTLYIPEHLKTVAEMYQSARCLPSFSMAITELIESHPVIAKMVNDLYISSQQSPTGN